MGRIYFDQKISKKLQTIIPSLWETRTTVYKKAERSNSRAYRFFTRTYYEELTEQFGSPKDIVIEYYNTVDDDYLLRKTNLVKYLKIVLFSALAIVLIYFGTHFVLLYKSYQDVQDSIIIHEETIIEDDE